MAFLQAEDRVRLRRSSGEEEYQVLDAQGLQQPLADDGEHGVQVGFRTQLAGELHQRAAVVVAVAVEMPVQPLLDPVRGWAGTGTPRSA